MIVKIPRTFVTPSNSRIRLPKFTSSKLQPADLAETNSRMTVPRPRLSMYSRSVRSSTMRLHWGINGLTWP